MLRDLITSRLRTLLAEANRAEIEWTGAAVTKVPEPIDAFSDSELLDVYEGLIWQKVRRDNPA